MNMNMIKYATPFVPIVTPRDIRDIGRTNRPVVLRPTTQPTPRPTVQPKNPSTKNVPHKQGFMSTYRQLFSPVPAGIPFHGTVNGPSGINKRTSLLNDSRSYPEKLSTMDPSIQRYLSKVIGPNLPIYLTDGRNVIKWLWNRRGGLLFTDEMWDNAAKARLNVTSQLGKLPQIVYYAYINDGKTGSFSVPFNDLIHKNNQFLNAFNPEKYDLPYEYDPYNGYTAYPHGTVLTPLLRLERLNDARDHEASHAANSIVATKIDTPDYGWVGKDLEDHMFFRRTNDPKNPYYDDATTIKRRNAYALLFKNTYLKHPSEYIGAMARVKRYGAELGFDTTNPDPAKARAAMAQTLHYFATHYKQEGLSPEQQRLHSWLDTAADNGFESMKLKQKDIPKDKQKYKSLWDYTYDKLSPFYMELLDFMTDATIQGLVRNDVQSNNATALQNLRYGFV